MRSCSLRSATALTGATLLIFALAVARPAAADLSHSGSANPTTEGWVASGSAFGSATTVQGVPAWRVYDHSTDAGSLLFYSAEQFPQAGNPWTLRAWLRTDEFFVDTIDMGVFMEVNDGSHQRFLLQFGSVGPGFEFQGLNWVHLAPSASASPTLADSWPVGPTPHALMLVELASNGTTADLFVNGVLFASGYPGFSAPTVASRVLWGSGSSPDTGSASWAAVAYVTGTQACSNGLDDDGNGLTDGADPYCESPLDPREGPPPVPCADGVDSDSDGICDVAEPEVGTDPLVADSDGDGYSDGAELLAGTDPLDELSHPVAAPALPLEGAAWLAALLGVTGAWLARSRAEHLRTGAAQRGRHPQLGYAGGSADKDVLEVAR